MAGRPGSGGRAGGQVCPQARSRPVTFGLCLTPRLAGDRPGAESSDRARSSGCRVRALRARALSSPVFFALTLPIAAFVPYDAEILWFLVFPLNRITYVWFSGERHNQPG